MEAAGGHTSRRAPVTILAALSIVALVAVILTWNWGNYRERLRAMRTAAARAGTSVDTRSLDAAEQLSQLAESRSEKTFAEEALRLADYSVDFAFAAAMQDAADTPAPLTAETREITARIDSASAAVTADETEIERLTQRVNSGGAASKDAVQEQLDLRKAQLELDKDVLEDAHQDLVRAGGDKQASIQRLRDQHEASQHPAAPTVAATAVAATPPPAPSIELTKSSSIMAQSEAWMSLNAKSALLDQARQNAMDREARLSSRHDSLEKLVNAEKAQHGGDAPLVVVQKLALDQKKLSVFDHRIDTEQDLKAVYGNWISYVNVRKQAFLHGLLLALFWVFFIALAVLGVDVGVNRVFADIARERRQLHTLRTILLFGLQALGVLLILIVIFGPPGNFGTLLAVIGAGLTVALQDFIIGFIGWFVLMGRDGMRPGDWVEINGVAGEVLEVGVFKTVLLETGNWSESVSPTGRKVTFVNSFAIQGHYFNFSTSGQWLWDELQAQVADGIDPYVVAEQIQKVAAKEIATNAVVAEQEWRRVVPSYATQTFSAQPTVSVRPVGGGVSVVLRYLSRASERQDVRARLYRALIELAQGRTLAPATPAGAAGGRKAGQEPEVIT